MGQRPTSTFFFCLGSMATARFDRRFGPVLLGQKISRISRRAYYYYLSIYSDNLDLYSYISYIQGSNYQDYYLIIIQQSISNNYST